MFARTREELQYLEERDKNSNVWKDNIRILTFGKIR